MKARRGASQSHKDFIITDGLQFAANIGEMSAMGIPIGWRSLWIATLAALFCAAGVRVPGRDVRPSVSLPSRMTFDATALAAALPSVLTPPVVEPGWRLVSMIAEDIDADGDLDVVASDESLGLAVWINDGSGRLTRQHGREQTGWRSDPPAPGFADRPSAFESIVPIPFFSLQVSPQTFWIAPGPSRRCCDSPADALRPSFVSTRTSRGPPVPVFLT
jgi:hypothetical protein